MYTFKSWFYELGVVQVNFVRGRNRIGLGLWELQGYKDSKVGVSIKIK